VIIYNLILLLGPVSVSLSVASSTIVSKMFPQFFLKANLGAILVAFVFLALTYKVFPNRKVKWLPVLFSALLAVLAMELAKWGYAGYVSKALIHNRIYGSLAAFPLFLIWIYVNWTLFLSGALLTYMLQTYSLFNPFPKKPKKPEKEDAP
jgi:membrane protein